MRPPWRAAAGAAGGQVKRSLNLLTRGLAATCLGMLLNVTASAANEGRFPEFAPGSYAGYVDAEHARLAWLGDWLPLGHYWLSPGDLFIYGGLAILTVGWIGLIIYGLRTGEWRRPVREDR